MYSIGTWWMWTGFILFIIIMLLADLFLFGGKKAHRVSFREAFTWVLVWVSFALIFNALLWWYLKGTQGLVYANQKALEFFTGYLIEQSLSIDNMFAFIMIFNYFAVPMELQRRVLLYGVLSAIVMRLIMIIGGTWLVAELHWILYLFGIFLIFTGIRMFVPSKEQIDLMQTPIARLLRRYVRLTDRLQGEKFFIKKEMIWYATPLFLALIFVEISDLVFALDSIPAIFAITNDAFIIFTSNIFAILGLRALYFLLAKAAEQFHLLRYGIAIMLIFIGIKMLIAGWIPIPIFVSLSVIVAILATTIILSIWARPKGNI